MTAKEIVKKYLDDNGYDGLVAEEIECACFNEDLFVCEICNLSCHAGRRDKNGRFYLEKEKQ